MAKKRKTKTKSKKKMAKKKSSSARSSKRKTKSKTSRKKTSTRKSSANKKKKTTSKKKIRAKKKPTTKKKSKKKTAAKKKAAAKKSKTKKKKTTSKKTASAPTGKKKTSKKATGTADEKKDKKRSSSKSLSRKKARSVAEVASSAERDEKGYVYINGRRVRMISTQGKTITKKKPVKQSAAEVQADQPKKPQKTHLSRKELNHYKKLLIIKRAELVGDLSAMEAEALRSNVGNSSHMPIHMADLGSDAYEQDFMLGLAEAERKQIREIDEALQRIEEKTYGVCKLTGETIPTARLDAKPWARYTIEAARIMESQQP